MPTKKPVTKPVKKSVAKPVATKTAKTVAKPAPKVKPVPASKSKDTPAPVLKRAPKPGEKVVKTVVKPALKPTAKVVEEKTEKAAKPAKAPAPAKEVKKGAKRGPKPKGSIAPPGDEDLSDIEDDLVGEPVAVVLSATGEKIKPLRMKISKAKERVIGGQGEHKNAQRGKEHIAPWRQCRQPGTVRHRGEF